MTVTYQDELGVVAVKINKQHGIVFGIDKAWFTDENDEKDYIIDNEFLISITEE